MAGGNSRFAGVSQSEILTIQEDAVPVKTKTAMEFGRIEKTYRRSPFEQFQDTS